MGKLIGFDKIKIRFDPILIGVNPQLSLDTVLKRYYDLSKIFQEYTNEITFSFVDYYPKLPSTIRTLTNTEVEYAVNYFVKKINPPYIIYILAPKV